MIDLYTWATPNGRKASVMLEEVDLSYTVMPVNIGEEEQHSAAFDALNPNRRIPVIVDNDVDGGPHTVIESGAILVYLAEKTGRLMPAGSDPGSVRARSEVIQWLMFQMGGIGPMLGQANHFATQAPEQIPYAIKRYVDESIRLIGVMNTRLDGREFLAGAYSIADIASYPWVAAGWPILASLLPDKGASLGNVQRWLDAVGGRAAVQRGMAVPAA
jgi:GST-like protein